MDQRLAMAPDELRHFARLAPAPVAAAAAHSIAGCPSLAGAVPQSRAPGLHVAQCTAAAAAFARAARHGIDTLAQGARAAAEIYEATDARNAAALSAAARHPDRRNQ